MNTLLFSRLRIVVLMATCFWLSACDGILQEKPSSFVGPENFYQNQNDATSALAGAYNQLTQGTFSGYLGSYIFTMLVANPTAEVMSWGGGNVFDTWRFHPANIERDALTLSYEGAYKGINAANAVIDNLPGIDMDPDLSALYVAEARFLRSIHYYFLAGLYGGVPIIRNETKSLTDLRKPRAPIDSVYTFMIEDLQEAIPILPFASETSEGRATKGAAQTLLAKIYLQRGSLNAENGFPAQFQIAEPDDFGQAVDLIQQVINSGEYELPFDVVNQFTDLFIRRITEARNQEIIFSIQHDPSIGISNNLPCLVANHDAGQPLVGNSWNQYKSTLPFYLSFDEDDLRRETTFLLEYTSESTGEYVVYDVNDIEESNYFGDTPTFHKYANAAEGEDCASENDFVIFRYADLLLMKAEALNEINKAPTGEAYEAINQVRERAGLEQLSGLDYESFRGALYTERRKELVTENTDWHDVQRFFDIATNRVSEYAEYDAQFPDNDFGPVLDFLEIEDPKNRFFPIPQSAIDRNPELTQNPGY